MYNDKKQLFKSKYDILMSYLGATPSDSKFSNKIYTVANKQVKINNSTLSARNENIGYAQFYILYHQNKNNNKGYTIDSKYVRVETNVYNDKLSIFANKIISLINSDVLLFGDENYTYISEDKHTWLTDKKYFNIIEANMQFGKVVLYEYNILKLLLDGKIKSLNIDLVEKNLKVMTGSYNNPNIVEINNFFIKSNKEENMIDKLWVQNDPKVGKPVYFCYYGCRYTNRMGVVKNIANELIDLYMPQANINNVMQVLYRSVRETTKKNVAIPAVFKLSEEDVARIRNNINVDSSIIFDNNKLVVFFSKDPNFDVIKNKKILATENMKEYNKEYQKTEAGRNNALKAKLRNWLKRHNNEFNPKWTNDEIELAKTLLAVAA